MGLKVRITIFIMAMPLIVACTAQKPPRVNAQSLDFSLNTASGTPMQVATPSDIIANPEATQIALKCESNANSMKQSGHNDAESQNAYYSCLQVAFKIAD